MNTTPILLVLLASGAAGLYVLMLWLKGQRRPGLIAMHLLLGLGGAEAVVAILHTSGLEEGDPLRSTAKMALGLMAATIFTGFAGPLLAKGRYQLANGLLAVHVCAGLAAVFLAINFATHL